MTDYVLWRRGLRGPSIARLVGSDHIDEHDKTRKIGNPRPIRPEDEALGLDHLARLYPPVAEVDAKKYAALRAMADDPNGNANERAVAARKASELAAKGAGAQP